MGHGHHGHHHHGGGRAVPIYLQVRNKKCVTGSLITYYSMLVVGIILFVVMGVTKVIVIVSPAAVFTAVSFFLLLGNLITGCTTQLYKFFLCSCFVSDAEYEQILAKYPIPVIQPMQTLTLQSFGAQLNVNLQPNQQLHLAPQHVYERQPAIDAAAFVPVDMQPQQLVFQPTQVGDQRGIV